MKRSKLVKLLCFVLTTVLALSMFITGCGTEAKPAADSAAQSSVAQSAAPETKKELEFVKLKYYLPQPYTDMSNKDSIMAEVNKILKEKINAELDLILLDMNNYQEKINVMSASGESWDICWGMNLSSLVNKGAIYPMNELLDNYGKAIMEKTPAKLWPAVTYGGEKMGVINLQPYVARHGASAQKALTDKYNVDVASLKTLKDLEPFLETIKQNEKGIIPFLPTKSAYPMMFNSIYDKINEWLIFDTTDNQLKIWLDGSNNLEEYKLLNSWYKKGYIAADAALKNDGVAEVKTQKYAVFGDPGVITGDGSKATTTYGFPCVDIDMGVQGFISTGSVQSTVSVIGKKSQDTERSMMFLDLLHSDLKLFNTLCYGLEGQDYKVVSGAGTDLPTIEVNAQMKWAIWHPWIGDVVYDQWPSNWNDAAALAEFQKNMDEGKTSPILGFTFDPTNVKTEVGQLDAIATEVLPIFITGSAPDFDKYVADTKARMEKAGLAKVMEEANKQLADWKAAAGK